MTPKNDEQYTYKDRMEGCGPTGVRLDATGSGCPRSQLEHEIDHVDEVDDAVRLAIGGVDLPRRGRAGRVVAVLDGGDDPDDVDEREPTAPVHVLEHASDAYDYTRGLLTPGS